VAAAGLLIGGLERWRWIGRALLALQDTTAQIRVRGAVALLMGFAALATGFGLEAILGSFLAGATISLLDRDRALTHQEFRAKLQAVGFGALIPYFFIATGMSLNVRSFITHPGTIVGGSIGVDLGLIRPANYLALVAAGLVSVIAFPAIAAALTTHKPADATTHRRASWPLLSRSPGETRSEP
jgi:Kef-type K+ transport system membrane component KefB